MNFAKCLVLPLNREDFDDYVTSVAFSPDGKKLASVTRFALVQLWDLQSGQEQKRFRGKTESWKITFSPDGNYVVTAGDAGVHMWNIPTGQERFLGNSEGDIASHPSYNIIASFSGGDGGIIRLRSLDEEQEIKSIGHTYSVRKLAFNHDGNILGTVSGEKTEDVYLWSVWGRNTMGHLPEAATNIAFHPHKDILASCYKNNIWLWTIEHPHFRSLHEVKHKEISGMFSSSVANLKFHPQGNILAWEIGSGIDKLNVQLWNIESDMLSTCEFDMHFSMNFAFSPDGKVIAICGKSKMGDRSEGDIQLWSIQQ